MGPLVADAGRALVRAAGSGRPRCHHALNVVGRRCDSVPGVDLAKLTDEELGAWYDANVKPAFAAARAAQARAVAAQTEAAWAEHARLCHQLDLVHHAWWDEAYRRATTK